MLGSWGPFWRSVVVLCWTKDMCIHSMFEVRFMPSGGHRRAEDGQVRLPHHRHCLVFFSAQGIWKLKLAIYHAGQLVCCCYGLWELPAFTATVIVHSLFFHDLHLSQCLNKNQGIESTRTLELSASVLEKWTRVHFTLLRATYPGVLVYISLDKEVLCQWRRSTELFWPLIFALS